MQNLLTIYYTNYYGVDRKSFLGNIHDLGRLYVTQNHRSISHSSEKSDTAISAINPDPVLGLMRPIRLAPLHLNVKS